MADSRVLSIDIETYGICAQTHDRRPLPSQTLFHPLKSLWHDHAPLSDLIQTCAITTCKGPSGLWDASLCAELEPQDTMVLNMWDPIHVRILAHNLRYAHTLIGMNLPFDLKMLRRFNPLLRAAIPHRRHFLLDLSIFNYLDNESRPERSLKDIGPLLRLFLYDRTAKNTVFSSPYDALSYNAQDSHNTVLALAEFARRIIRNHWKGPSDRGIDKASTYSLSFYNRVLWTCIRLAESGIAVSHRKLTRLNNRLLRIASEAASTAAAHSLTLSGEGSPASKLQFLTSALQHISTSGGPDLLQHPLLQLTDKTKELSLSESNQNLILSHLPPNTPLREPIKAWQTHTRAMKLVSTYTAPILGPKLRKKKGGPDYSCTCVPPRLPNPNLPSETGGAFFQANPFAPALLYPDWYPTPGSTKEDSGSSGGTKQGRLSAKNPSSPTFPGIIKRTLISRYPGGTLFFLDLKQIELVCAGLLSGDDTLLNAFRNNLDLHSDRAIAIFKEPILIERYGLDFRRHPRFRKRERQVGKRVNFADLFRSGPDTMQASVYDDIGELFPLSVFIGIRDSRPLVRPGLWKWQEGLLASARRDRRITLPLTGQSRYYMGGELYEENEIVNQPVQTVAANFMLEVMAELSLHLEDPLCSPPAHLTQNTYDSLVLDSSPAYVPKAREILAKSFEAATGPGSYWALLSEHLGRTCPVSYELEEHTPWQPYAR